MVGNCRPSSQSQSRMDHKKEWDLSIELIAWTESKIYLILKFELIYIETPPPWEALMTVDLHY